MGICPKCGEEIDYLLSYSGYAECASLDDNENVFYSGGDYLVGECQYECPKCCEEVAFNEGMAKEILKAKKIRNDELRKVKEELMKDV
jgi:hypothetical protein